LQPSIPTTTILDFYVFTIRTFNELDPKGVLLDRIARPIRRYLKERENTVKILLTSLLANVEVEDDNRTQPSTDISREIAVEMRKPIPSAHDYEYEYDWGNMEWTPDPIDAGPGKLSGVTGGRFVFADIGGLCRVQKLKDRGRHFLLAQPF
jgi:anaphase-promoting complex subunit 2